MGSNHFYGTAESRDEIFGRQAVYHRPKIKILCGYEQHDLQFDKGPESLQSGKFLVFLRLKDVLGGLLASIK